MVNKPKAIGTRGETAAKRYLQENGFPLCDRRPLKGNADEGDLLLTVGVIAEVKTGKHAKDASYGQIQAWLQETETERVNANAAIAILIVQRKGFGTERVAFWDCWFVRGGDLAICPYDAGIFNRPICTTLEHAARMIRLTGYGDPLEVKS